MLNVDFGYAWKCGPRWALWYLRLGRIPAFFRTLWFTLCRGHIGEACQECGRPYLHWRADHEVYERVTGLKRYASGEWAPGLFCLECFDGKAHSKDISILWKPTIEGDEIEAEVSHE